MGLNPIFSNGLLGCLVKRPHGADLDTFAAFNAQILIDRGRFIALLHNGIDRAMAHGGAGMVLGATCLVDLDGHGYFLPAVEKPKSR